MIASKNQLAESQIDVRFSKACALIIILLSHAPLVFAAQQVIALRKSFFQDFNFVIPGIAFLAGLLIIGAGMSQPKRWYLRLDLDHKVLMVSSGIRSLSRKHPFDSIRFDSNRFYIEKNDVKKKVAFLSIICNRKDLKTLGSALEQTP